MDLGKLSVEGTTVTADFTKADYAAIKAIYDGLGDKNVEGKVTGADGIEKDAFDYAIDSYVMNTFARYAGALHRVDNGVTVSKITFDNADYTWNGTAKGSNWKNDDGSLVAKVTANQSSALRDVTLTINGENVNFKAVSVPTKEDVWADSQE